MTPLGRHGALDHRQLDCLFKNTFKLINKTMNFHITGLLWHQLWRYRVNIYRECRPGDLYPSALYQCQCQCDSFEDHIDGLVQVIRNSSAFAMELRLSCTKPLINPQILPTCVRSLHYSDVITGTMATRLAIVYLTVNSGADQRKHQSSASPVTGESPVQMASKRKIGSIHNQLVHRAFQVYNQAF